MKNRRWPQDIRDKALCQYLEGIEMVQISVNLEVPTKTLHTWHYRGGWVNEKKKLREVKRKAIFNKLAEKMEANATHVLEAMRIYSAMACRALRKQYESDDAKVDEKWARILLTMSQATKNIMPTFSDDLATRISDDLRRIAEGK